MFSKSVPDGVSCPIAEHTEIRRATTLAEVSLGKLRVLQGSKD